LTRPTCDNPGIQKIQDIFREKAARLYHWAESPTIPADNNRAERELRHYGEGQFRLALRRTGL
jgi:hypothetical protein